MVTAEACLEGTVVANQLKVDAVEIGADGVEILSALLLAGELHASFFEAETAEVSVDFVVDHFRQDSLVSEGISEFYLVVYYLH
jgi:hypothetical protein